MTTMDERRAAAQARTAGQQERDASPLGAARSLAFPAQLRAKKENRNGQLLYHLNGIASVTDTPYEMYDAFGPYDEIVDRGAFTETLASEPDVAFLVNHRGVTMARTTNGTLELGMVDEGLGTDAWLNPKRQDVADLVLAIEDRNIDQMSFAFMLEEGWWSEDFSTFKITKLSIDRGDVSAVNYGANPYTSIAARSREILDDLGRLPEGARRAAFARLGSQFDPQPDQSSAPVIAPTPAVPAMGVTSVMAWLIENEK